MHLTDVEAWESRLHCVLVRNKKEAIMTEKRRISFIVNPASGINRSALDIISLFVETHADQLDAAIHLTEKKGDATRFAEESVRRGVDLVAAYGGDGTMMEAAMGVMHSNMPLLMLPGGTANVMAVDLKIPTQLEDALKLALSPELITREVDMGSIDNEYFLLRAGIGYEAEMSAQAAREHKSKKGRLAYFENAIHLLRNLRSTSYILTVDGETYVRSGITCMICNSSGVGIPNLRFTYNSDVSDGYLDVIVIRDMRAGTLLKTFYHILRSLLPNPTENGGVHLDHWQAKQVTVQMKHRQFVARDGEPLKRTKRVSAEVIPAALRVVVPPNTTPVETESVDESLDRDQTPA